MIFFDNNFIYVLNKLVMRKNGIRNYDKKSVR